GCPGARHPTRQQAGNHQIRQPSDPAAIGRRGGRAMAVVLITGCSSGFGLATAVAFARRGDRVWVTMRNPADAGDLTAALEAEHLAAEILPLDVTDDASVAAAVGHALEADGRIDVLVNNAGVGHG